MARNSMSQSLRTEISRTRRYSPIRQRLIFAKEYIRTGNATGAWGAAFPQSVAEYKSRRASASKYLKSPLTQATIERLREKSFKKIVVSLEELVAENAAIVRFDPARIYDEHGTLRDWEDIEPEDRRCIGEIKIEERIDEHGHATRITTVKRQDRGAALDRLAKMFGAYARDNAQKSVAGAMAALETSDPLQIAQRFAFLLNEGMRSAKGHAVITQRPALEGKST